MITRENLQKISKEYWLHYWEVEYIYTLDRLQLQDFYNKLKDLYTFNTTNAKYHIKRKLNFLDDTFFFLKWDTIL